MNTADLLNSNQRIRPSKTALIYFVISFLWIFFSDKFVEQYFPDTSSIFLFQTLKGLFFISATSLLIYFLIKNDVNKLLEQKNLLQNIFEISPVGITILDDNGKIQFANKEAEEILGLKKESVKSRYYNSPEWQISSIDGSPFPDEELPFMVVKKNKTAVKDIRHAIVYPDGNKIFLSINAAPIMNKKNEFSGMIASLSDITKQIKYTEELKEKEMLLQETGRLAKVGGWEFDAVSFEGKWTDEVAKLHDVDPNYPINVETGLQFYKPESKEKIKNAVKEAIEEGKSYDLELEMVTVKGNIKWVRTIGNPIWENNKVVKVRGSFQDITEIKLAEESLRQSEELFKKAFRISPDSININRLEDGLYIDINEGFTKITGYTREDVIGKSSIDINIWADINDRKKLVAGLKQDGIVNNLEAKFKMKDGKILTGLMSAIIFDLKGVPHILSITRNIDSFIQTQQALRESEERWQFALEGPGDGVWDWNAETNKVFFSHQWKAMLGYNDDEIGDTLSEWESKVHPDDLDYVYKEINKHFNGEKPIYQSEHRMRCKDGSYKWILDRGKVIKWNEEKKPVRVIGTHTDITERKKISEELENAYAILHTALDQSQAGIAIADEKGLITFINKSGIEIGGKKENELAVTIDKYVASWQLYHFDGRKLKDDEVPLARAVLYGETNSLEFIVRRNDKDIVVLTNAAPIKNKENQNKGGVAVFLDITERKNSETKLLEYQKQLEELTKYLQTAREEEREAIAREIHDEFGQVLTSLKMNLSLVRRKLSSEIKENLIFELSNDFSSMMEQIDKSVHHMRKLITELRPEILDKLGLIPALEWQTEEFTQNSKIESTFNCLIENTELDKIEKLSVFRILQESLTNIAKHSKANKVEVFFGIENNNYILRVSDNGTGFKNTNDNSKSFGLIGMKERARLIGGDFNIVSELNKGTTINLSIPRKTIN